jgi:hypothetical protein
MPSVITVASWELARSCLAGSAAQSTTAGFVIPDPM